MSAAHRPADVRPATADAPATVRDPLLDAQLRTVAYELRVVGPDGAAWSGDLLPPAGPAYLEVALDDLARLPELPPPPGGVVVPAPGGAVDSALVAALRALRARGHGVVVKLRVVGRDWETTVEQADRWRQHGFTLLAADIDDHATFDALRTKGFELFAGRFYERARLDRATDGLVRHSSVVAVLAEVESAGADPDAIDDIIKRDVGLSYQLLRHVNSAYYGLPRTVTSVRHAIAMLGTDAVRQWARAMLLQGLGDTPHALLSSAMVRARTCETIVGAYDRTHADPAFTVGLFSLLDVMLEAPLQKVLAMIPLNEEVKLAITYREGLLGRSLEKVIAYADGDFDSPALAGHSRSVLAIAYGDAVRWADSFLPPAAG